jgi:acetyl esterase/lipase
MVISAIGLQPAAAQQPSPGAITFRKLFDAGAPPAPVAYVPGGGLDQSLYCFPPTGAAGAPRPAIVLIHGGAWVGGSAEVFFPLAHYFASRGAVAFSINYRLVTKDGPSMEDCVTDCRAALAYIRAHAAELGVDPNHIAVLGDSAGGHLAAVLATGAGSQPPTAADLPPNAAVLCNAITDMTDGDWMKFVIRGAALERNAPPSAKVPTPEQLDLAKKLSPLTFAKAGLPPMLIMHGTDDKIVPAAQASAFADAVTKAGNHCELVLIPHGRHAFILPKYSASEGVVVDAVRRADTFLAGLGFLQGPPTLEVSTPPLWVGKY